MKKILAAVFISGIAVAGAAAAGLGELSGNSSELMTPVVSKAAFDLKKSEVDAKIPANIHL